MASLIAECGLQGTRASVGVMYRFSHPEACSTFPVQGSNPCSLRWQADFHPLDDQEHCQCISFYNNKKDIFKVTPSYQFLRQVMHLSTLNIYRNLYPTLIQHPLSF